jgi:hypothetical protein
MSKKKRTRSATTLLDPGNQRERELRAQVADLLQENNNLRHRLDDHTDPWSGLDNRSRTLLDRLTRTLLELRDLGDPLRSSPIEAQMSYKNPDSTIDEGKTTRIWRDLENRIHRAINPLLQEYEQRTQDKWKPQPKPEKVWCRNSTCPEANKRLPRYVGPKTAPIELTSCPGCAGPLTAAT